MVADRHTLRAAVGEELKRIDRVAAQLWDGDCDFTADSGHPGWSYGHLATHIARGSDFLAGTVLTLSSDTDELLRNAVDRWPEIDYEATRPGAVIITDFEQATHRFASTLDAVPQEKVVQHAGRHRRTIGIGGRHRRNVATRDAHARSGFDTRPPTEQQYAR